MSTPRTEKKRAAPRSRRAAQPRPAPRTSHATPRPALHPRVLARSAAHPRAPLSDSTIRMLPPRYPNADSGVAVSTSMTRYTRMSGDMNTSVRITSLEPLVSLAYPTTSAVPTHPGEYSQYRGVGTTTGTTDVTVTPYVLGLKPGSMPFYQPYSSSSWNTGLMIPEGSVNTLISLAFTRYRVRSARLHFCPNASTTESAQITLAFSNDPAHPLFGLNDAGSSDYPYVADLMTSANAVTFSAWSAWSAHLPVQPDQWYYRYLGPKYGTGGIVLWPDSDTRQTCWGAIACLGPALTGSPIQYGQLYLETEYEYSDPSPVTRDLAGGIRLAVGVGPAGDDGKEEKKEEEALVPTPASSSGAGMALAPDGPVRRIVRAPESTSVDDEPWDTVVTPRFASPPTAAPGGSLYTTGRTPSEKKALALPVGR